MRHRIKLLTFLFFLSTLVNAQLSRKASSPITLDGKTITLIKASYILRDTIQKLFYESNRDEIWKLRTKISELSFDHCSKRTGWLLYYDTLSSTPSIQIISSTGLSKFDSIIATYLDSAILKFKAVPFNDSTSKYLVYLRFRFYEKLREKEMQNTYNTKTGSYRMIRSVLLRGDTRDPGKRDAAGECSDGVFFYDEGVKCFNQGDYKKAVYNFSQALFYNERDMDSNYFLGLSYQKIDKLKKGCDCFSKGVAVGDTSSEKAFNKYCLELK